MEGDIHTYGQMYGWTYGQNFPPVFYRTLSPIGYAAQKADLGHIDAWLPAADSSLQRLTLASLRLVQVSQRVAQAIQRLTRASKRLAQNLHR